MATQSVKDTRKIPAIDDKIWVHEKWVGKTALAIVLRRMGNAFLIRYLGKDDRPYGFVFWYHFSLLTVID